MNHIRKKIVTDEANRPVAVQIDYKDWLEIERQLGITSIGDSWQVLRRFEEVQELHEDPLEFQQRMRGHAR